MEESNYLKNRSDLLQRFQKLPFTKSLDEEFLREMLKLSKFRKYHNHEVITKEGEYDSYMYIILSGKVRVVKNGSSIAQICTPGETFGELAIVDGECRSASVLADGEALCLAIDASFIDRLTIKNKDAFCATFYKLIAEIIARRLRNTIAELTKAHTEIGATKH